MKDGNEKNDTQALNPSAPLGAEQKDALRHMALELMEKYSGNEDQALEEFFDEVARFWPTLDGWTLDAIWKNARENYNAGASAAAKTAASSEQKAENAAVSLEPYDYTDVGQATVFAQLYGDRLKYTTATHFLVYDGVKWVESDVQARGLSQELTQRQLQDAKTRVSLAQEALYEAGEDGSKEMIREAKAALAQGKKYQDFVIKRRGSRQIHSTLIEVQPMVELDLRKLDADPFLLNTPEGTVDLRTGEMRPHRPEDYCTKVTAVSPGRENEEMFRRFLYELTCGDESLQAYLQQVIGMCLVGKVFQECLIIAYGSGGNGKSTFFNFIAKILGDYAGSISAEVLTVYCGKNKSPEYAELRGERMVIAAELQEGTRLDTSTVKKLCSTDDIQAEKKYKDPFHFTPSHNIILYTNHLPNVGTTDKGTWDRLIVVPFGARFREMDGQIENYADVLLRHCGGAALSWGIEGAKEYIANGCKIDPPPCVREATGQYKEDSNWMANFLTACCEVGPDCAQGFQELFSCYESYCLRSREHRRNRSDFKQALQTAGFDYRRTNRGMTVFGLRLRPSPEADF